MRKIHRVIVLLVMLLPALLRAKAKKLRSGIFYQYGHQLTFYEAQESCRDKHTDLITLETQKAALSIRNGRGWLGLSRENDQREWRWSTGQKADFIPWADEEPVHDCVFKYYDEVGWRTDPCTSDHTFMCSNHRTFLVKDNKTWEEALHHCRSLEAIDSEMPATAYLNHRYDLVSLGTDSDHEYARWVIQLASSNMVWTGLHFLAGQWRWTDGEDVDYTTLPECPASGFCGALDMADTEKYHMVNCMDRKNFLCFEMPD